ncbi:MAG: NAD-dependent epimerase/dehydratase family protein [Candidatus Liptonbacteria bacterium]
MDKKILIIGAAGQIGSELVPALQARYGIDSTVALAWPELPAVREGVWELLEMSDTAKLEKIIQDYNIGTVYHLVSLLSAKGEQDPALTWQVNIGGLKSVLDLAVKHKLKVFWPSSIATFGPTTPHDNTPQRTVLEPTTMYGVTKTAGELLCQYYHVKYGLDIRSIRYPGIISAKTHPGGGTTDYAVAIFYAALKDGKYTCYLKPDTMLPMMYMDDAIRATLELMDADPARLTVRTSYNLAAISFTPEEIAAEISKRIPLAVTYEPDARQAIADSWPNSIDDSVARTDWGWKHEIDLPRMCDLMVGHLKK